MEREKQIELERDLIEIFDEEYEKRYLITPTNTAEKLTEKGYRKKRQGEWQIRKSIVEADLFCSNCGYQYTLAEPNKIELYNYCPNCGSIMKGAE